jgi:regulatory protein
MGRQITALKAQKRNKGRVGVYLDGEYAFGLSRIVAAWLHVGQELGDDKISDLESEDALEVAYQSAIRLIGFRMRTSKEIQEFLKRKDIAEPVILKVLERLRQSNLVDDLTFSRSWVENRTDFRPRGRRMLAMELRHKGIPEQTIQEALEETGSEEDLAYRAAEKYARKLNGLDKAAFRLKLGGFLARRGFTYETARQVIESIWLERSQDNEKRI